MKTLLCAATKEELQPFLSHFKLYKKAHKPGDTIIITGNIHVLITGIGCMETSINLQACLLQDTYQLIVGLGIAGTFNDAIAIGDLVLVQQDCFADLGAEDAQGHFLDLQAINLSIAGITHNQVFPINPRQMHYFKELKAVKAITVNKTSGSTLSIDKIIETFNPDIETMEGGALFFLANRFNTPSCQIRSISNRVEPRNRDNWNMPLAVKNLNAFLMDWIKKIEK